MGRRKGNRKSPAGQKSKLMEQQTGAAVNLNYKDTVFRMLFQEKKRLLDLYNAVSGKDYDDPEKLEIVTLENAIYMGMKNDMAFLIDFNLYLYEHQSTISKNMPRRFLQYVDRVRTYAKDTGIEKAVDRAIDECIEQGILREFLLKSKAEVKRMSIFEYDEEATRKAISENAFERGVERGRQEDILQLLEELGQISSELKEKILLETDREVLKKWLKLAARAESIDEFIKESIVLSEVHRADS